MDCGRGWTSARCSDIDRERDHGIIRRAFRRPGLRGPRVADGDCRLARLDGRTSLGPDGCVVGSRILCARRMATGCLRCRLSAIGCRGARVGALFSTDERVVGCCSAHGSREDRRAAGANADRAGDNPAHHDCSLRLSVDGCPHHKPAGRTGDHGFDGDRTVWRDARLSELIGGGVDPCVGRPVCERFGVDCLDVCPHAWGLPSFGGVNLAHGRRFIRGVRSDMGLVATARFTPRPTERDLDRSRPHDRDAAGSGTDGSHRHSARCRAGRRDPCAGWTRDHARGHRT